MTLAIYAIKCDVPIEKLKADVSKLIPIFNDINPKEPFTIEDAESALECYDERYCTFPIKDIEKLASIRIERNKRNGERQRNIDKYREDKPERENDYEKWEKGIGERRGSF